MYTNELLMKFKLSLSQNLIAWSSSMCAELREWSTHLATNIYGTLTLFIPVGATMIFHTYTRFGDICYMELLRVCMRLAKMGWLACVPTDKIRNVRTSDIHISIPNKNVRILFLMILDLFMILLTHVKSIDSLVAIISTQTND